MAKSMTVFTAAIYLLGAMMGAGLLAMPKAVQYIGWYAIILAVFLACCYVFSGITLAKCWLIITEELIEYKRNCVQPYAEIAYQALGKPGRWVFNATFYTFLFGVTVVQLLLAAETVNHLMIQANVEIDLCYWILIVGGGLIPFTWLRSPKNMWPFIGAVSLSALVASVFIIVQALTDTSPQTVANLSMELNTTANVTTTSEYNPSTLDSLLFSFSIMMYSFCFIHVCPSVQFEMKHPKQFKFAAILSMAVGAITYISIAVVGYAVYGDGVQESILDSLPKGWMQILASAVVIPQVLVVYVTAQNPIHQAVEDRFDIPKHFGWRRILIRLPSSLITIFIAMTCPSFGKILNIVGGCLLSLLAFVYPSLFYLQVKRKFKGKNSLPRYEIPLRGFFIVFGVVASIAATTAGIKSIINFLQLRPPCYLSL